MFYLKGYKVKLYKLKSIKKYINYIIYIFFNKENLLSI